MIEQKIKIDKKEYTVVSADWNSKILLEAAAQLEKGILYYKQTKDELSSVVLAALAFAYDSVSNSKELSEQQRDVLTENEKELQKILQKITKHIQSPHDKDVK